MTGNYPKRGTYSLLLYCFIYKVVLNGQFADYLEDKDIVTLNRLLRCLGREKCLIKISPSKERIGKPKRYYISDTSRFSETNIPRFTEDSAPRTTEIEE